MSIKTRRIERSAMRQARQKIAKHQSRFYGPPKRSRIESIVKSTMMEFGLRGTNVERYFYLWAVCAMLNYDPFCRNWRRPTDEEIENA